MASKKPTYQDLENELSLLRKEIGTRDCTECSKKDFEQLNKQLVKAKEQLEISEEKLQLIIKNSNDIFVLVNEHGEQTFISDAAAKLTGYTCEELNGPIEDVIYHEDVEIVKNHWSRIIANTEEPDRIEYCHIHKQKGYIWLEAIAQNYLGHPAINAVVANIRDITERKNIEHALKVMVEEKDKEITLNLLQIANNNQVIKQQQIELQKIKDQLNPQNTKLISDIDILIKNSQANEKPLNWDRLKEHIQLTRPTFLNTLLAKHPNLTRAEQKLSTLLSLHLSTKEIASITNQHYDSVRVSRTRLRKKLELDRSVNIVAYLSCL